MKLWLLRPAEGLERNEDPWEPYYEKTFGFVVRAASAEDARQIADRNSGNENQPKYRGNELVHEKHPWLDERLSTCTELCADGEPGVIIQDHWQG